MKLLNASDTECVSAALSALNTPGAVVLLPTETVYGLVCRADDPAAIDRIYQLKHRDSTKVLAWFIGDYRELEKYGVKLAGLPERLAERYCPGAITVIAPGAEGKTVGFRVPDHPLVLEILRQIKVPLCSTSANRSGHPNALSMREALEMLAGEVTLAIDGGDIPADAKASTVVDATGEKARILRQGPLTIAPEFLP